MVTKSVGKELEPMNDFEEDEVRAHDVYEQWRKFNSPPSYSAFKTAQKGKLREEGPIPPAQANVANKDKNSAPDLTATLSTKFGLPEPTLQAFSAKAIARGLPGSKSNKQAKTDVRYKPFRREVKEQAGAVVDKALGDLLHLSKVHGTDPTMATRLFQKKLEFFSNSVWDMWQMAAAADRIEAKRRRKEAKTGEEWDNESQHESENEDSSDEDSDEEEEDLSETGDVPESRLLYNTANGVVMLTTFSLPRSFQNTGQAGKERRQEVQQGESCCNGSWP